MKLSSSRQWSSVIIVLLPVVLSEYFVYCGGTSSGVILVRIKRLARVATKLVNYF